MPRAPRAPFVLKSRVLASQRASRARRLRGLGLAVVVLSGLSCTTLSPRPPELAAVCMDTLRRGVFNTASLACFPEVERPLEEFLCATRFGGTHHAIHYLGFGYGTAVLGQTLREADPHVRSVVQLDRRAEQRWRQEHCAGPPTRSPEEAAELRERALSLLPASLVGPWRGCADFFFTESNVRCLLLGSFDQTGEDEMVQFEASYSPVGSFDFGTHLTEDLIVQGADCGGERWRSGTRLSSSRSRLLRCRRRGRSAVYFQLVAGKGRCEARLPELTEPPWQVQCQAP